MVITITSILCFGLFIMIFYWLGRLGRDSENRWIITPSFIAILLLGILSGVYYLVFRSSVSAWFFCSGIFTILLLIEPTFTSHKTSLIRWLMRFGFALLSGSVIAILSSMETRFSEEEFFYAIQSIFLSTIWLFLRIISGLFPSKVIVRGYRFPLKFSGVFLITSSIILVISSIFSYQRSFYPAQASLYPGISEDRPFMCGKAERDPTIYQSLLIYENYIHRIEALIDKTPPETGFLALATGQTSWYELFKQQLLAEATQMEFTQPAHSIKYSQYQASLRVFFYSQILKARPSLFSTEEQNVIQDWFRKINHRALIIEWVDLLYAIAYAKIPSGPYENQDIGPGLLSLLEINHFSNPSLQIRNRNYLEKNLRGFSTRFRNTDDAFFYQSEWMDNAYFQSFLSGSINQQKLNTAKEWLLIQAVPDGFPLAYNQPSPADIAGSMMQLNTLNNNPAQLWLAGRVLEYSLNKGLLFRVRPGIEYPADENVKSPTIGSCLVFGDSGLPNQEGPLAPDKIIFRNKWSPEAKYLALNLRFTGWHRYKATNNIILYYEEEPIIVEDVQGKLFDWLPEGRSLFRDKRIPRENLNGLIVEREGMDYVVSILTGVGSQWAQDPPFYADIDLFLNEEGYDYSRTTIRDWNGWVHQREIYFYHQGPTIIIDLVEATQKKNGGIVWNFSGKVELSGNSLIINPDNPSKISFITDGDIRVSNQGSDQLPDTTRYIITAGDSRKLFLITAIFPKNQLETQVFTSTLEGRKVIHVRSPDVDINIPIHEVGIIK
jgi:hypothetical protein